MAVAVSRSETESHVYYRTPRTFLLIAALIVVGMAVWVTVFSIRLTSDDRPLDRALYEQCRASSPLPAVGWVTWLFCPGVHWSLSELPPATILFDLFCLAMLGSILLMRRNRLLVSPEGIEYRSGFYGVSTPWSNVTRIEQAQDLYGRTYEVLSLREPARIISGVRGMVSQRQVQTIPLFILGQRPAALTRDLKLYAPQLSER